MKRLPLRLRHYAFDDIALKTHFDAPDADSVGADGSVEDETVVEVETEFLLNPDHPDDFMVVMTVRIGAPDRPTHGYSGHVSVRGVFTIGPKTAKERRDVFITNAAPSMLYGAVREFVLTLSGRGPLGPLTLPPVEFPPGVLEQDAAPVPDTPAKTTKKPAAGRARTRKTASPG